MLRRSWFLILLLGLLVSSSSKAAIQYFDSEINYWEGAAKKAPRVQVPERSETKKSQATFDWSKYTHPKTEKDYREFFKEGNYTPPAPFIELVRNPSDSNIENWFAYIDKKNQLATRMHKNVERYLSRNNLSPVADQHFRSSIQKAQFTPPDVKRYRFRLYFDSKCPHCKKMFRTVEELQSRGYAIEVVQTDNDISIRRKLPFPVVSAKKDELHQKDIKSVPVLFVGDLKKKVVYRLPGFQTTESIFSSIQNQRGSHIVQ